MSAVAMFFVRDVEASSAWYQELLGARSAHGGNEFDMIESERGNLLLQLHHLEGEEHAVGALTDDMPRGEGVLLCVEVGDVHAAHERAVALGAEVLSEPIYNELAGHTEFTVKDPDGYALSVLAR